MAGFFKDTSGLDASSDFGSSNNVSADLARQGGDGGFFDRLFGKKEAAPAAPGAAPAPAAPQPSATPQPAISSGGSLVRRILSSVSKPPSYNADGAALVPGTPFTPEEFAKQLLAANHPPPPPPPPTAAVAPFQGIPQFTGPEPPQRQPPSPFGNQTFGGHTFGGHTFGGAQFGSSAPPPPYTGPQAGAPYTAKVGEDFKIIYPNGPQGQPQQPPQMPPQGLPVPPRPLGIPIMQGQPQGFFRGGPLHLMRGGYPSHLMMGLPQRFAHGGSDYVQPDGQGDGRSDHVAAKLSPGEYVMDAETVALLGNGDNSAGARELDGLRKNVRKQKGKALAKGKFSPNAKAPEAYMRGAK